jgi:hypothetical protein
MKAALFYGSSHIGAIKVGYDRLADAAPFAARFAAAPAADIAFTEVIDSKLVASERSTLSRDSLSFFFSDGGQSFHTLYLKSQRPLGDVRQALEQTAGSAEIALGDVSTIFYVVGMSPYDFLRLGESAAPVPKTLRNGVMEHLLGSKFGLKPQIDAIRKAQPGIRHAFIGIPFRPRALRPLSAVERDVLIHKRAYIASIAGQYLFDDVFLPDEVVLDPNMLTTRAEFFEDGRQQTERFLGGEPTESDSRHANGDYGAHVLDTFVRRCLA